MSLRFSLFLPLATLLCFFHSIVSDYHLMQHTCKTCSETDPNISYDFCITSLQADPHTHHANNLFELGLITINLITLNVTDTKVHIKELVKEKLDPYVKVCLCDCLELYSGATLALKEATEYYKAKRYADCNIKVSSVMDASRTCEDGFEEMGVTSPLIKRNDDTFQLSAIALSITNAIRIAHKSEVLNFLALGA